MLLATHWYDPSSAWISISSIVATYLSALVAAFVTYLFTVPRRRLRYALVSTKPAVDEEGMDQSLQKVAHRPLSNPVILNVCLSGHGSRDIPSSAFDMGNPLVLDVGIPLVDPPISLSHRPLSVQPPKTIIDGTALKIGPGLINRRHVLEYAVLADQPNDKKAHLVCKSSLVDVVVRRDRMDVDFSRDTFLKKLILIMLILPLFTILISRSPRESIALIPWVFIGFVVVGAAGIGIAYALRLGRSD